MRILQLSNKFVYPPKDGGALGIYNYTKAFASIGCKVTMLAMNTSKHPYDINKLPPTVQSLADWRAVNVDNQIKALPALICFLQNRSYHISRFISADFNTRLIELLHEKEFDIIQLEGLYLSPYVETIRGFSSAKIVMRAHNIEHEIWERVAENEKNILKRSYLKILSHQLKQYEISRLNKYDLLTSVTQRDAEILKQLGCVQPIHVCPAPYDETILKPDRTKTDFSSVFFIGALDWLPNQEGLNWFLKEVWGMVQAQLLAEKMNCKLYIAGRNARASSIHPADNSVLVGEVEDGYDFMNSKGIMIVPLLSGSGIRVKIIEGMAMGKTIVSTRIGAEGIDCKHGQNILIADTPELFAEQIIKCLKNKIFSSVIGDNAHQFAKQHFGSKQVAGNLLSFYQNQLDT